MAKKYGYYCEAMFGKAAETKSTPNPFRKQEPAERRRRGFLETPKIRMLRRIKDVTPRYKDRSEEIVIYFFESVKHHVESETMTTYGSMRYPGKRKTRNEVKERYQA